MAATKKRVTYREPAGYFNEGMRKVAEQWEKEHAKDKPAAGKTKKPAAGKTPAKKK